MACHRLQGRGYTPATLHRTPSLRRLHPVALSEPRQDVCTSLQQAGVSLCWRPLRLDCCWHSPQAPPISEKRWKFSGLTATSLQASQSRSFALSTRACLFQKIGSIILITLINIMLNCVYPNTLMKLLGVCCLKRIQLAAKIGKTMDKNFIDKRRPAPVRYVVP